MKKIKVFFFTLIFTLSFNNNSISKKVAPIICYESIFGEFVTGFTKKGANFFAILTNDAWWGETPGHKQLLSYSRLRAIENRRDIVRSANTGISGIIDPIGNTNERIGFNKQSVFHGKILLNKGLTFYAKYGSVFAIICLGVVLFQGILLLRRQ